MDVPKPKSDSSPKSIQKAAEVCLGHTIDLRAEPKQQIPGAEQEASAHIASGEAARHFLRALEGGSRDEGGSPLKRVVPKNHLLWSHPEFEAWSLLARGEELF